MIFDATNINNYAKFPFRGCIAYQAFLNAHVNLDVL